MTEDRRIRIGVDTGGTFTDVVAVDERTGEITATKTPSTPADPALGLLAGIDKVLDRLGLGIDGVVAVSHGTTVATNKLLEGGIDDLGFVTNEGYRHVLEIARQSVPDGYGNSYFWVKPPRIVPPDRIANVRGRLAFDGSEIEPLDLASVEEAAECLHGLGVRTVGVCLLHSYANPAHERAVRDVLRREHPDAVVSISSDVLREYREYERSVTTLVDAAVKPAVRGYLAEVGRRLAARAAGHDIPFMVMKSNGGVLSATEVVEQPITTVLSGPAAGALGAASAAQAAGYRSVVTCDGGGTSTDVAVVVDGRPKLTTEASVGGYPTKVPMIDVTTIGSGGGSIARRSREGTLKVGPESAGADPGPTCYGTGGERPTLTDAHLVLGRLPERLLGGEMPLQADLARSGLAGLADEMGLSVDDTAAGMLEVAAWSMANALRRVTVSRGLDVRDFHLVAFGGSGPLQVCRLVDLLGLPGALVPVDPGNLSAYGLLTVDVRNDYVQTVVASADRLDVPLIDKVYGELTDRAGEALAREGFAPDDRRFERSADLRYAGQAFEVSVPVADGPVDAAEVADAFHALHRQAYGYDFRGDPRQPVEWVNLRVTGVGPIRRPDLPEASPGRGAGAALTGRRRVHFGGWVDASTYDRSRLGAGDVVEGPAVIEEFSSTVPIAPGFAARVDQLGNLVVRRGGEAEVSGDG